MDENIFIQGLRDMGFTHIFRANHALNFLVRDKTFNGN